MRCFTVYIDLTVFVHIARSHGHGVGILAAVSVSDFLHAFRATRFLLSLRGGLEARHQRRYCSLYYHHEMLS